jgi:hypothetical protein
MSLTDLVCDTCGQGPFKSLAGLLVHQSTTHTPAPTAPPAEEPSAPSSSADEAQEPPPTPPEPRCPDCGRTFATAGALGTHRRSHRSAEEKAAERRSRQLAPALTALLPAAADELVARLATFVATHQPAAHHWVVASADAGPWLCTRYSVGTVAERAEAPVVAVPIQLVIDHLGGGAQRTGDRRPSFHAGAAWPHPKAAR